jgi:cyclic pyranopterin phosphate synthase
VRRITDKIETRRTAVAEAVLTARPATVRRLLTNRLPKPDVLPVARAAGILAAKRTWELVPYCHPVAIEWVEIAFRVSGGRVRVRATVESVGKTGVEMEALTAVSVASLTVYDMLKPIDAGLAIGSIRLLAKRGGKSDQATAPRVLTAAILVASDSAWRGRRRDRSGALIREILREHRIPSRIEIVPDEEERIRRRIVAWADRGVRLILTTGGTGLGPRDVTVEATRGVIEREVPGIMEAARSFGQRRTPHAMLSRGLAGTRGRSLILNLPGSPGACRETLQAVFPGILHAFAMMEGRGHRARR